MQSEAIVDQTTPTTAYEELRDNPDSALVDVRTVAEWTFVGLPDLQETGRQLATVEWVGFPAMAPNPAFYDQLVQTFGRELPGTLFFICRSGARSLAAARLVAERAAQAGGHIRCVNVREGFEGDLDPEGRRGRLNGWKQAGLPWRQN